MASEDTLIKPVNLKPINGIREKLKGNLFLYIMLLPAIGFALLFQYIPMLGLVAAFQDYNPFKGYLGSPLAAEGGFQHIIDIFRFPEIYKAIFNTLILSVLNILIGFPAPIILALLLNELRLGIFKKTVQTISYMPYFLSWISVIGLTISFLDTYGPINDFLSLIMGSERERVLYLSYNSFFLPLLIILNLWKNTGWSSIIYLASISSIDQNQYEAAEIDGASRLQQIRHITLPGIAPTIAILLIMNLGFLMASNFELVYGLQNPFINFETIDTFIFKNGVQQADYSQATAVGFTRGIVAIVLTIISNYLSKKFGKQSIV